MVEQPRPLMEELQRELRALKQDLGASAVLRWRLARLELEADLRSAARLAVAWGAAAVMALAALPLVLVWLADGMGRWLGVPEPVWLLVFAGVLLSAAALVGVIAWRRFRRRFLGLEQTLEELREDLVWLGERFGKDAPHDPPAT